VYTKWQHPKKSEEDIQVANKICNRLANLEANSGKSSNDTIEISAAKALFELATSSSKMEYFFHYYGCLQEHGFSIQRQFITTKGKKVPELQSDLSDCLNLSKSKKEFNLCTRNRGWYLITNPPWFFENKGVKVEELDKRAVDMESLL